VCRRQSARGGLVATLPLGRSSAHVVRRPPASLTVLVVCAAALAAGCGGGGHHGGAEAPPPTETTTVTEPPPETTTATTQTETTTETLPPPSRPMSWQSAGAFVWHETDIDPGILGAELRDNGFGWVAVFLHEGTTEDPIEADWVRRFRLASGLPVGGWGVLRSRPVAEATLADSLVRRYGLDFYIANAEADYEYSGPGGFDGTRFKRSRRFVDAFRALQPSLPAGLSSYCRADMHDIDWPVWQQAGFVFLPQAYVNDLGAQATPAACARGARGFFAAEAVHPTIGMHPGARGSLTAEAYAPLLARAGTVGFSVYLAETRMPPEEWQALGAAITRLAIAR
jgi:hypothetical protein